MPKAYYNIMPTPYSLLPTPYSLLPTAYSLLPKWETYLILVPYHQFGMVERLAVFEQVFDARFVVPNGGAQMPIWN